jgi:hypothetical protein
MIDCGGNPIGFVNLRLYEVDDLIENSNFEYFGKDAQ